MNYFTFENLLDYLEHVFYWLMNCVFYTANVHLWLNIFHQLFNFLLLLFYSHRNFQIVLRILTLYPIQLDPAFLIILAHIDIWADRFSPSLDHTIKNRFIIAFWLTWISDNFDSSCWFDALFLCGSARLALMASGNKKVEGLSTDISSRHQLLNIDWIFPWIILTHFY